MPVYVFVALSYFLGTIPFGVIFAHLFRLGDIRQLGSGSTGATNVLRTGNYAAAVLTLAGDFIKGFIPVSMGCSTHEAHLLAIFAVLGHVFSPWLKFRGGKGVATAAGALYAMDWLAFTIACLAWGSAFALTRVSSVAALVSACAIVPIYAVCCALYTQVVSSTVIFSIAIAVLVAFTHRSNIRRIITKEEFSFRR